MERTDINSPAFERAGLLASALIGVVCGATLTPLMAQPSSQIPLFIISLIFAAIGGCTFAARRYIHAANRTSAALTGGSATLAMQLDTREGFALSIFALIYGAAMTVLTRLRHPTARSAEAATREIKWLRDTIDCALTGNPKFSLDWVSETDVADNMQYASTGLNASARLSNFAGRSPAELRGLPFDCLLAEGRPAAGRDRLLMTSKTQQAQLDSLRTLQFLEDVIMVVRPPLNTILGFAEILQSPAARDLAEDERRTYHQLMLDCSRQLSAFIADVGDMARIDANHFHLIEQEVDAAELTEIAMKFCGAMAEEADAVVIVNVIENVELRCDAARVRRVLVSLVTRAAKAGRSGSSVNVSFVRRHDGGLDILVTDQGPVLSSDDIAQAFEPSLHEPGMEGLSLPIARRIALLHGGSLTMEPAPGGGMSACLSLPSNRVSWKSGDAFETPRAA